MRLVGRRYVLGCKVKHSIECYGVYDVMLHTEFIVDYTSQCQLVGAHVRMEGSVDVVAFPDRFCRRCITTISISQPMSCVQQHFEVINLTL